MLNLRIRKSLGEGAQTSSTVKVKLEINTSETVGALKTQLRKSEALQLEGNISWEVSLNRKDALGPDDLCLKDAGVRSGDLLHIISLPSSSSSSSSSAQQAQAQAPVQAEGRERPAETRPQTVAVTVTVRVDDWLQRCLEDMFGFKKIEQVRSERNPHRCRYILVGKKNRDATATAEFVFTKFGGSGYQTIYGTVLGYKEDEVYKSCVKLDGEDRSCGICDPHVQRQMLDEVILPVVRDACFHAGFQPPALLDTANDSIVDRILQTLEPKDLGKLCCVSKHWLEVASDNSLWNMQYKKTFGYSLLADQMMNASCKAVFLREMRKRNLEGDNVMRKHSKWMNFGSRIGVTSRFEPHDDSTFPAREVYLGGMGRTWVGPTPNPYSSDHSRRQGRRSFHDGWRLE